MTKNRRSRKTSDAPDLFSGALDLVNRVNDGVSRFLGLFGPVEPPRGKPSRTRGPSRDVVGDRRREKFDNRVLNLEANSVATGALAPYDAEEGSGPQFMHPQDAAKLAKELMSRHGVTGWTFGFNRGKRTMGLCRYKEKRIELSYHFVIRNVAEEVRDVILHEIAHALAGHAAGHGPKWRARCREIGARPERCGKATMPVGRWAAKCSACTQLFTRHRRPLRGRTYSCGKCGPERGSLEFRVVVATE